MQLSTISLALTRLGGLFSPAALFVGSVQGAWYDPSDLSTLFTTSAGTTPVAMPGQGSAVSVGLMLDKSQNGVGTNGAKRVNLLTYSEQFDNAAWTKQDASIAANSTTAPDGTTTAETFGATAAGGGYVYSTFAAAAATYTMSVYAKANTASQIRLDFVTAGFGNGGTCVFTLTGSGSAGSVTQFGGSTGYVASITSVGNGWYRCSLTGAATATTWYYELANLANGQSVFIWGADLRLASEANTLPLYQPITSSWYATLPGNHAISFNNTTARPELRARVNLLTYSEEFDNAAWLKVGGAVSANTTVAPDGTTTADTFTAAAAYIRHGVLNTGAPVLLPANTPVAFSAYIRKGNYNFVSLLVTNNITTWFRATFDFSGASPVLSQSANGAGGTYISASVEAAANGFWRLVVRGSTTDTTLYGEICLNSSATPPSQAYGEEFWAAAGTETVIAWGADLRPANIGANVPAYQRIADANTYDTSGFPLYLRFDGIDDSMYTPANLNLSGTDKVAVFAGVRQTAAGSQQLVEFSADVTTNNGSFSMPKDAVGAAVWTIGLHGTSATSASSPANYAAPITTVNAGLYDIGLSTDEAKLRINGAQVATSGAGSAGTGNFGTYPLFIGARNNSSLWFNGHLHSLIIAGSAVSAGNISATEQWVAGKTGIQI